MDAKYHVNFTVKGFQREMEALQKAERDLYEAKRRAAYEISKYLEESPGETLTCGDIGRAIGISPLQARQLMHDYGYDLENVEVAVKRRYAEVDEFGNLVPGAPITEYTRLYSGFVTRGKKDRHHHDD